MCLLCTVLSVLEKTTIVFIYKSFVDLLLDPHISRFVFAIVSAEFLWLTPSPHLRPQLKWLPTQRGLLWSPSLTLFHYPILIIFSTAIWSFCPLLLFSFPPSSFLLSFLSFLLLLPILCSNLECKSQEVRDPSILNSFWGMWILN